MPGVKLTDEEAAWHRTIGARIRVVRRAKGFGTRGLAKRAQVSPTAVTRVEQGAWVTSAIVLRRIVRALDMPLDLGPG